MIFKTTVSSYTGDVFKGTGEHVINTDRISVHSADGLTSVFRYTDGGKDRRRKPMPAACSSTPAQVQAAMDSVLESNRMTLNVFPNDDTAESAVVRYINYSDFIYAKAYRKDSSYSVVAFREGFKISKAIVSDSLDDLVLSADPTTTTTESSPTFTLDAESESAYSNSNPIIQTFESGAEAKLIVLMIAVDGTVERGGGAPYYKGQYFTDGGFGFWTKGVGYDVNLEMWWLISPPAPGGFPWIQIPNTGGLNMMVNTSSWICDGTAAFSNQIRASNNPATAQYPAGALTFPPAGGLAIGAVGSNCIVSPVTGDTELESLEPGAFSMAYSYSLVGGASHSLTWTQCNDAWNVLANSFIET